MSKPDKPINNSEAQRNAPAVNYEGHPVCPLCKQRFNPNIPHRVTTGDGCIEALKSRIEILEAQIAHQDELLDLFIVPIASFTAKSEEAKKEQVSGKTDRQL